MTTFLFSEFCEWNPIFVSFQSSSTRVLPLMQSEHDSLLLCFCFLSVLINLCDFSFFAVRSFLFSLSSHSLRFLNRCCCCYYQRFFRVCDSEERKRRGAILFFCSIVSRFFLFPGSFRCEFCQIVENEAENDEAKEKEIHLSNLGLLTATIHGSPSWFKRLQNSNLKDRVIVLRFPQNWFDTL